MLCYLEGLTHEAAARRLNWPVGTVEGRLVRARGLLRSRLTRRGLAPAIGLLAATACGGSCLGAGATHALCRFHDEERRFLRCRGILRRPAIPRHVRRCLPARSSEHMRLVLDQVGRCRHDDRRPHRGFRRCAMRFSQDSRLSGQQEKRAAASPRRARQGLFRVLFLQGANIELGVRYIARGSRNGARYSDRDASRSQAGPRGKR